MADPVTLFSCLSSLSDVETLLLLRRSPDTYWTPVAVAGAMACAAEAAAECLRAFRSAGFLATANGTAEAYRYAPERDVVPAVEALAAAYRLHPQLVEKAIASRGEERVRAFSEAFRVSA